MSTFKTRFFCALTLSAIALPSFADEAAIKARQGLMRIYAQNLGILGSMAKGDVEYNSESASAAAARLLAAASFDQSAMWPQGSDNVAMEGKTGALPALWTTFPAVLDESKKMITAAEGMVAAAGVGLPELQAAMGPVGAACGSCHKAYRAK